MNKPRFPVLFVSHGAPTLLLRTDPIATALGELGQRLPRPEAVLVITAHWKSDDPVLGNKASPATVHDFYGFPDALYQMHYPCRGAASLGEEIAGACGMGLDPARDLDHGTWVVLRMLYPQGQVPVLQMAVCPERGTRWALEFSSRLQRFRDRVLIIGSGGLVHNLGSLDWHHPDAPPEEWSVRFASRVRDCLLEGDPAPLLEPWSLPHGERAAPTLEHYLPLIHCLGAAPGERFTPYYEAWQYRTLSMQIYGFGAMPTPSFDNKENSGDESKRLSGTAPEGLHLRGGQRLA